MATGSGQWTIENGKWPMGRFPRGQAAFGRTCPPCLLTGLAPATASGSEQMDNFRFEICNLKPEMGTGSGQWTIENGKWPMGRFPRGQAAFGRTCPPCLLTGLAPATASGSEQMDNFRFEICNLRFEMATGSGQWTIENGQLALAAGYRPPSLTVISCVLPPRRTVSLTVVPG
jgi:hypothetical protein